MSHYLLHPFHNVYISERLEYCRILRKYLWRVASTARDMYVTPIEKITLNCHTSTTPPVVVQYYRKVVTTFTHIARINTIRCWNLTWSALFTRSIKEGAKFVLPTLVSSGVVVWEVMRTKCTAPNLVEENWSSEEGDKGEEVRRAISLDINLVKSDYLSSIKLCLITGDTTGAQLVRKGRAEDDKECPILLVNRKPTPPLWGCRTLIEKRGFDCRILKWMTELSRRFYRFVQAFNLVE